MKTMIDNLDEYRVWYEENYGVKPCEKLCKSFCRSNGLPWPPAQKNETELPSKPLLSEAERKELAFYAARTGLEEIAQFVDDVKGADEIARHALNDVDAILGGIRL